MKRVILAALIGLLCAVSAMAWTFSIQVFVGGNVQYAVEINTLQAKNDKGETIFTGGQFFFKRMPSDPEVACICSVKVRTLDGVEIPMSIKILAKDENSHNIHGVTEAGVTGRELFLTMDHPKWLNLLNRGY